MMKGFSLIELMLVILIISLLSTFSIQRLFSIFNQRELDNATLALKSTLRFAQHHAQASGFRTIVCPSLKLEHCNNNMQWSTGWIVFQDSNENNSLEAHETVVLVKQIDSKKISLSVRAAGKGEKIIFYRNGRLWPNGHFALCHQHINEGIKLIFIQSGRFRNENITQQDC